MTESRRPLHVGVALGLSTGVYAVSLAVVTGLESDRQASEASAVVSTAEAVRVLRDGSDRLAAGLADAAETYDAVAARYERLVRSLDALDGRLERVASTVGGIEGASVSLPTRVALPSVGRAGRVAVPPPPTNATTGASGH